MANPYLDTDFVIFSACESTSDGGTWTINSAATDTESKKQGTYSLYGTIRTTDSHYCGFVPTTPKDISGKHMRVWFLTASASLMQTKDLGGCKMTLSDGTNSGVWKVLGSDTYQGGWRLILQDPSKTPDAGVVPNLTAITSFRLDFTWLTSPRNVDNTWIDYLVAGNGYRVLGGTSGDPVTWDSIAAVDAASGYGIVQRINGIYFVNGQLTFGHPNTGLYFYDRGETVVFLQEPVNSGLYRIDVRGGKESTTSFILGDSSNTGDDMLGYNGCSITTAGGVEWTFDASSTGIDVLKLYGCNFSNMSGMFIGSETASCGGTGSHVHIVDNLFAAGRKVVRSIGSGVEDVQIRIRTVNWTDNIASVTVADNLGIDAFRLSVLNNNGFTSKDDNVVETIQVLDHDFSNLSRWVYVYNQKSWDLINPVGTINTSSQTQLTFSSTTGNNLVTERFTLDVELTDATGASITGANIYLYEGFKNKAIQHSGISDTLGDFTTNVLTRSFTPVSTTGLNIDQHGTFALRIYKYGRQPYISPLTFTSPLFLPIPLLTDANITEANQATAIANGAGITLHRYDIPLYVMHYVSGVGDMPLINDPIMSLIGTRFGVVVEAIGSSTDGIFVLSDVTESFINEETIICPGWNGYVDILNKPESFSGEYTWLVDCNNSSMTTVYDYLSAKMSEYPLENIYRSGVLWGGTLESQLLYRGANGYYTRRNTVSNEGVWVANRGLGTVAYFTADGGQTYTPPIQYTFTVNGLVAETEVRLYNADTDIEIAGTESSSSTWSYSYIYPGSDTNCYLVVLHMDYLWLRINGLVLSNANQSIPVQQVRDRNFDNPE
jgi:hypothetical protein